MDENMLKQKYNDLLESLKKGEEYLKENPTDEKGQKRMEEIAKEMENIANAFPNITADEINNGFKIEESEQVSEQVRKENKNVPQETKLIKTTNPNIIKTTSGDIELTPQIVKKYLVNGQSEVTDQEVMMFIGMCKANRLNPFNKEAYLIKYGSQPASIITSKDVFFKRAIENPCFDGMESGIIVINAEGKLEKREGHIYIQGEKIAGAWCKVYRKDWEHPIYQEVNMVEYAGKTKTGELNSNWKSRPAVMITKVAEATALRKAFTDNLQGMYLLEENEDIEPREKEQPQDIL
jgi:phage recombination protein Bet